MKSVGIRGSVIAAVATIFVLGVGIGSAVKAQETALSAAPELAAKGVWNPSTTYVIDDLVTSRGSTWRSKRNNNIGKVPGQNPPSTAAFWELFARGFNPTGAWLNSATYQPDDLVTHQGQTWRAKRTVAASVVVPAAGANWELLVTKGAAGATGAQGPAGPNTGIGAGSQSVPSISFSGSTNTGIFSPEPGKIAMVQNGNFFMHSSNASGTALGHGALNNGAGVQNTAMGAAVLSSNTTGQQNTAVGASALSNNTDGNFNTAVGSQALLFNTGSANTAIGASALTANTSGQQNTAIGSQSLSGNATGNENIALGYATIASNITGSNNVAVGNEVLNANTTGNSNVAIGHQALTVNQTGESNVAVGFQALQNSATSQSTAIGFQALQQQTTGQLNTAVGSLALSLNTSGQFNVAIGQSTLFFNTTGSNNVAVGSSAGGNASASNNSIFIGNTGQTGNSATIKIGTEGTQDSAYIAGIAGATVTGAGTTAVNINTTTGQLGITPSSLRYKYDIEGMADVSAMLAKLRPVTFRYKEADANGAHPLQYGLIAEEVAEVFPYLAVFKDGRPETVQYHALPSFLLAGYQAQQKTIAAQEQKIEALEDRLRRLEALLPQTKAAALQ